VKARTTDLTDDVSYCEVAQVAPRPVVNTIHTQEQHGLPRTRNTHTARKRYEDLARELANSDYPTLATLHPCRTDGRDRENRWGGLMAEIIKLVSEWGNLAKRVSATPDQIGGQRFIRLTFYSDDNKAIAAVNISADASPDLIESLLAAGRT
jgi:hypothetical protein